MAHRHEIATKSDTFDSWRNTRNTYQPNVQDNGVTYDKDLEMMRDRKLEDLFKSEDNPGFLIDTENFTGENENDPLYAMNEIENRDIEPDGKTITVDRNYLKRHHIIAQDGLDVLNLLKYDSKTRNLLVPSKFKKYEKTIIHNFKDDFKFKRTLKDNYKKDQTPVRINIIYVKNSSQYPTYNKDIGGNDNKIKAPIAIVETWNTHIRNYQHYITESYFFESHRHNPFNSLSPLLNQFDLKDDIKTIESVYNTKVDDVNAAQRELIKYVALACLTLTALMISIITAIHLYFANCKYAIFLKYNLGYSFLRTHSKAILLILAFNTFMLFTLLSKYVLLSFLIFIGMLILELILIMIEFIILNKKNQNEILKGKA
ncbi:hypothetical protein [Staphylococcus massiliensis]|nr:hypothetical protein [Staphylococcus massiliensis]